MKATLINVPWGWQSVSSSDVLISFERGHILFF